MNRWLPEEDRFPPIDEAGLTPEQRAARDAIIAGPRGRFGGPFVALIRSPGLMDRVQRVGEHVRWRSTLAPAVRELTALIAVRHWDQPHEMSAHARIAREEGVADAPIEAILARRRPEGEMEGALYDFCQAVLADHAVDDETYGRLHRILGDEHVIEVLGVLGYFVSLSMVFNVARTPLPEGVSPP